MNDLPYVLYRPKIMFMDTIGMSKDTKVAHRQLADYIWSNDGPPRNDNESLRDITSCAASDWARVKSELVRKGWVETQNYFLHKGIIKTLNESKEKYVRNHNKVSVRNNTPIITLLDPHPETGVRSFDNDSITDPSTSSSTDCIREEEGDKSHTPIAHEVELPPGFPKSPDDAIRRAANIGCPTLFVTTFWNLAVGRGGRDARDVPIRNFAHSLAAAWSYEQNRKKENETRKPNSRSGGSRSSGTLNEGTASDYAQG